MSDPCEGEGATHSACPCVLRRVAELEALLENLWDWLDWGYLDELAFDHPELPGRIKRALGEADG